jgi:hypothetical protein
MEMAHLLPSRSTSVDFRFPPISTELTARWIAFLGYACALFLLVGNAYLDWVFFIFPSWVLLVSVFILRDNLWGSAAHGSERPDNP